MLRVLALVELAAPERTALLQIPDLGALDTLRLLAFARAWHRLGHGRSLVAFPRPCSRPS